MGSVRNVPGTIQFVAYNFLLLFPILGIYLIQLPFQYLRGLLANRKSSSPQLFITVEESQRGDEVKDTVVLIHGFPDGPPLWSSTVRHLTSLGYRCLLVGLPGCKGEEVGECMDFGDLVDQLHGLITREAGDGRSVTMIAHDWGSFFGITLVKIYPKLIHRIVLLDVGEVRPEKFGGLWALGLFSYQVVLAVIYKIGRPIGTVLMRWYLVNVFMYRLRPAEELQSDMTWLYFSMLSSIIKGGRQKRKSGRAPGDTSHSPVPTMFLYGMNKNFFFHDDGYTQRVRETSGGYAEGFDAGHWLQCDKEEQWLSTLSGWLDSTSDAVQSKE